jgi:hypothetical protein
MASWNQAYGKLSSRDPSNYSSGSPELHLKPQSSLPSSTSPSDYETYTQSTGKGRPPSNNPSTSNDMSSFASPRWNPASLINPRSFHQVPQQRVDNGFTNNIPAQQLEFQFDSPGSSYLQQSHAHAPPQHNVNGSNGFAAYANGGGMGHMLERMHNVADRDLLPQKRRKIYDDRPEGGRKSEFHGGGKGGVIGEYMRERREEGQKENVANRAAVDLSSGLLTSCQPHSDELTFCS